MKYGRLIGTGILTVGTLTGAALAATPSKADMDFCNQRAAQVSKAGPVQPGAGATRQPAPLFNAAGDACFARNGRSAGPGHGQPSARQQSDRWADNGQQPPGNSAVSTGDGVRWRD